MKRIDLGDASLDRCVTDAQQERVVLTRGGKPVALIIGVEGLDEDQLQLGASDHFWELIRQRRSEKTLSRSELEQKIRSQTDR